MKPLTKKQKQTLDFVEKYYKKYGYHPAMWDICHHFKLVSVSSAWERIDRLAKKGYIIKKKGTVRGIQLNDKSQAERELITFVRNFNPAIFYQDPKGLREILKDFKNRL